MPPDAGSSPAGARDYPRPVTTTGWGRGGERIGLVEVSPRDGLQNEARALAVEDRVELVTRCLDAGVRRIEAVSFVHPGRVPQMAGAEEVMDALPRRDGVSYIGLVLNQRGLERALAAGVHEVNVVVSATDSFAVRNQGVDAEQALATAAAVTRDAHAAGVRVSVTVSVAFGCPFEGEVAPSHVDEVVRRAADAGPDEVALADTIGVGVPVQVRRLVAGARAAAPGLPLRAHFHDTRRTGVANALAAAEAGVATVDASAGGIGGCPFAPRATGNVASEDVVYALHRSGWASGVDPLALAGAGEWVCGLLGREPAGAVGRAGWFPPPGKNGD